MSDSAQSEEAVFSAALKLPGDQRAAYLQEVCGRDAQLRARVEALLQAVGQPVGSDKTRVVFVPLTENPGDVIGRYKLLEKIGEGGFGAVYVAEQREPVRRRVALKIIKLGMDTKEVVARFEAERQALALMDHPHIAKVFDAGATAAGRPYFVMELVRGMKITEFCDEHKLPVIDRLKLFIQVCRAVQHAHQKGVIHRDIKPPNILVAMHEGAAVPKVIDFGIAKATQGSLTDKTVYTEYQQFIGTPAYMSPEQAQMSALDIDTRSDIYSLGVLLYELLTGKTPFDQSRLLAAGLDEMRQIIREKEPVRPSMQLGTLPKEEQATVAQRHGTELPALIHTVRGDLDWIVMKALEKDRVRRYDTANGLAMDVERHLKHEPVVARPPSVTYRLQRLVWRNKLPCAAAAAVVATLIVGIIASTQQAIRATRAEQEQSRLRADAQQARKQAEADAQRAQDAASEARNALATSDFLEANRLIEADEGAEAAAYLSRILAADPVNETALARLTALLTGRSWIVASVSLKHEDSVIGARFSPDGSRVVTTSGDAAQVWDAQTGQPITSPLTHASKVEFAELSPDGKCVVTASDDATARIWNAQTGQPLSAPMKHDGWVVVARFSPDGKRVVTASSDGTAQMWDAHTGRMLTAFHDKSGQWLDDAEFSPDGRWVVTASYHGTAQIIDVQTGAQLAHPPNPGSVVYCVRFSPDGKRVATATYDAGARVWDAQTGEPLTPPMQHAGPVNNVEFSPDGRYLVTASSDSTARVWNSENGEPVTDPLKNGGPVSSAQFSPNGEYVVTATANNMARVWDVRTGRLLIEPLKHGGSVHSAQFSPDGSQIVTASQDGMAQIWVIQPGRLLSEQLNHSNRVRSAEFSPDGKRVVTASYDRSAQVWDAQTGRPLTKPLRHKSLVYDAVFSPDGERVATGSGDGAARVWDVRTGEPLTAPMRHGDLVITVQFSPDGRRLLTGSYDNTARVWDAQSGQPLTEPIRHRYSVNSAQFSPDGKRIVTASYDDTARIWDAQTGEALAGPFEHDSKVLDARFSPDGNRIVTATYGGAARVWDARTGRALTAPMKHGGPVNTAQFSPDGKRILTGSADNTARIWDAQTGQPLTEPMTHAGWVFSAQFSADGKRVLTGSWDHTARVWDAQSGQPLIEPLRHWDRIYCARFSPDGTRIVTASDDQTARVWDVGFAPKKSPDWLLPLAEALSGIRLNRRGFLELTSLDRGKTIAQIRAELNSQPHNDDGVAWGRWLLADRATRTVSPLSALTVPEYIESAVNAGNRGSLDEARRLVAGMPELSNKFARLLLKTSGTNLPSPIK